MTAYLYGPKNAELAQSIALYAKKSFKETESITEESDLLKDWKDRSLGKLLNRAKNKDTIIVFDALTLARSHIQVLTFLEACLAQGVDVEFVKYGHKFKAEAVGNFIDLIALSRAIENDFVSRRNEEAIAKRQEFGIVLGRPKGRKNKALKLDKFKKDIIRYLELSISKASIAKLVDCHPQTLYDWIDRNDISDMKPRRKRSKKLVEALA